MIPKISGYYVARKTSILSRMKKEVVQVDLRKNVVWRTGVQRGYYLTEFHFYRRIL